MKIANLSPNIVRHSTNPLAFCFSFVRLLALARKADRSFLPGPFVERSMERSVSLFGPEGMSIAVARQREPPFFPELDPLFHGLLFWGPIGFPRTRQTKNKVASSLFLRS